MTLHELVILIGDLTEIIVMILLVYVIYKVAMLIDTLSGKMKGKEL
jgi:hypothetical protein